MKLVLFDIDGTLTLSDGVGRACFLRALSASLGVDGDVKRWSEFAHVTDTGITGEVLREHHGREPSPDDFTKQHEAYHGLLREALTREPNAYRALPGAIRAVAALRESSEWEVGIASGNWREAGSMKLRSAGFGGLPTVSGFADDAVERPRILSAAIDAANKRAARRFDAVVYVGDALWDLHAAAEVGVGFVGVCTDKSRRAALSSAGATRVFPCYSDLQGFTRALHEVACTRNPTIA